MRVVRMVPETDASGGYEGGVLDTPDDELVLRARAGDDASLECLLVRYEEFARAKARPFFLTGAEREDIVQEGMIGLYKAIRDFLPDRGSSFRTFAELCITRQIVTAVKAATRQKHVPLNSCLSLTRLVSEDDWTGGQDRELADVLTLDPRSSPLELVISREELRAMHTIFREILSNLEVAVLDLYLQGRSYEEIADSLSRQVKSIDNAVQRIKRKIEQHLEARRMVDAS